MLKRWEKVRREILLYFVKNTSNTDFVFSSACLNIKQYILLSLIEYFVSFQRKNIYLFKDIICLLLPIQDFLGIYHECIRYTKRRIILFWAFCDFYWHLFSFTTLFQSFYNVYIYTGYPNNIDLGFYFVNIDYRHIL